MPYIFETKRKFESKICPGVTVTFRKITEKRRIEYQTVMAEPNTRVREILEQIEQVKGQEKVQASQLLHLNDQMSAVITKEVNPAKIKWAVASISGLKLGSADAADATVDDMLDWPSDLTEEILNEIDNGTVLAESSAKNSESPITSGAVKDTATGNTTVTPASGTDVIQ